MGGLLKGTFCDFYVPKYKYSWKQLHLRGKDQSCLLPVPCFQFTYFDDRFEIYTLSPIYDCTLAFVKKEKKIIEFCSST